jgi:TPR repeat protein
MLTLRRCVVGAVLVLLVTGVASAQTPTPTEVAALRVDANAGNTTSQSLLRYYFSIGRGVPQDYAQAVTWFRQAAEQGDADAQANLGSMYFTGRGVPQDYVEAHKWRNLAASRASEEDQTEYAETRDALAKQMTPAQLAEAQTLAREWHAAFDARQE